MKSNSIKTLAIDTRKIFFFTFLATVIKTINIFSDSFISGSLGKNQVSGIGTAVSIMAIFYAMSVGIYSMVFKKLYKSYEQRDSKVLGSIAMLMLGYFLISTLITLTARDALISSRIPSYNPDKEAIVGFAKEYFVYSMLGISFTTFALYLDNYFMYRKMNNWLFLCETLLILINITLSSILVFVFKMGVVGYGIGTMVAAAFGLIFKAIFVFAIRRTKHFDFKTFFEGMKFKNVIDFGPQWWFFLYETFFYFSDFIVSLIVNLSFKDGVDSYYLARPYFQMFALSTGMVQIVVYKYKQLILAEEKIDFARTTIIVTLLRALGVTLLVSVPLSISIYFNPIYKMGNEGVAYSNDILLNAVLFALFVSTSYNLVTPLANFCYKISAIEGGKVSYLFLIAENSFLALSVVLFYLGSLIDDGPLMLTILVAGRFAFCKIGLFVTFWHFYKKPWIHEPLKSKKAAKPISN